MSRRFATAWVVALVLAGCGSSEDGGQEQADATPQVTTELMCDDSTDDDGDGMTDCDDSDCADVVDTAGACVNDEDLAIYRDLDGNVEWNKCVPGAPTGRGCLTDVDCNTTCVQENTGLSMGCSRCFAELVSCFIGNCAQQCGGGGGSPACTECVANACGQSYGDCFGRLVCEYEYGCRDTADNDGDGLIDAADPDCQ